MCPVFNNKSRVAKATWTFTGNHPLSVICLSIPIIHPSIIYHLSTWSCLQLTQPYDAVSASFYTARADRRHSDCFLPRNLLSLTSGKEGYTKMQGFRTHRQQPSKFHKATRAFSSKQVSNSLAGDVFARELRCLLEVSVFLRA